LNPEPLTTGEKIFVFFFLAGIAVIVILWLGVFSRPPDQQLFQIFWS
jgi:hypothetical protein